MRDVARDAGVDVALVSRYFGSKEGLFKEVLRAGKGDLPDFKAAADLPALLAALATDETKGRSEKVERLLIILRSASSPAAAEIVRGSLNEDVLEPLAAALDGAEADRRAAMAMAVIMGTTVLRSIMAVEPVCDDRCQGDVTERLRRLLATALA